ncbi:MAG: hypothetical protein AAB787_00595 [Patescibacteria group bacterium]
MAKGFVVRNNLTKETLLMIASVGAATLVTAVAPGLFVAFSEIYFKDRNKKVVYERARKLRELEKKKLVSFKELRNGEVRIKLTHRGKILVRQYNLENIRLNKPKKWDGKWHILMYDIPSTKRKESDAFRYKVKQLGLYQLQKSVWVAPYDFMPEIEFIATIFEIDINKHIFHLVAKEIPKEREIREVFGV